MLLVCLGALTPAWAACDQVPAGQTLRVRLLQPISSYSSKPGMPVQAILIESPQCDGSSIFPIGAGVEGKITYVKKVGLGFRHEAAAVEIEFDRIVPKDASPFDISAQVVDVDNARETVKDGMVHGILSTDTIQSHFISLRLLELPSWDPEALWVLPVRRALFPYYPEPEIFFPRGTDVLLKLTAPVQVAMPVDPAPLYPDFDSSEANAIDGEIPSLPEHAFTRKGKEGDIVNLAFIGTREQVVSAFQAAGWTGSDSISTGSVLREAHALFSLNNYSHLPISKQLLDGEAPDFSRQKSLDSYEKRDHLRIWSHPAPLLGEPLWLSGSIHEVSAQLSLSSRGGRFRFLHHLDGDLDEARDRVVRDLALAGCVDAVHYSPRPAMKHFLKSPSGDDLHTDARVAVVLLRDCHDPVFNEVSATPVPAYRPRTKFARYMRTQVLTFRSDLWRTNAIYTGYELGRAAVRDIRRKRARDLPPTIEVQDGRSGPAKSFLP